MFRRLLIAALALCALGPATAQAQGKGDQWVLIGTKVVNLKVDNDRIDVTTAKGRFKAIRLVAKRSGVTISRVSVTYSNCAVHNEVRKINLLAGERTRPIDLRGDERFVDHIDLVYQTAPGTIIPASVEVYGLQSAEGAAAARPAAAPCPPAGAPAASGPPPKDAAVTGPIAAAPTKPGVTTAPVGTLTAGGDVLLGVQYVGFAVDKDVIRVGGEYGKFDKIRLRVLDADIHILEMKVIYTDGEPDVLAVKADVKANTRTQWFALKGDRFIKQIDLLYKARAGFRGTARVEAFGEYAEGWTGAKGPGRTFNRGWVYLGAQSPLFFSVRKGLGYENDVISVGRNTGGFSQLRLDVKDRAITLNTITIAYADGTEDIIPVKSEVKAASSYGPIQVKPKPIKEIRVSWRSRLLDKEAKGKSYAFVEFWAQ